MSDKATYICGACGKSFDEFGDGCPHCGVVNVFCENDDCGRVFAEYDVACPSCGEENLDYIPRKGDEAEPDESFKSPLLEPLDEFTPAGEADQIPSTTSLNPTGSQGEAATGPVGHDSRAIPNDHDFDKATIEDMASIVTAGTSGLKADPKKKAAGDSGQGDPALQEQINKLMPPLPGIPPVLAEQGAPRLQQVNPDSSLGAGFPSDIVAPVDVMPQVPGIPSLNTLVGTTNPGAISETTVGLWADLGPPLKVGNQGLIKLRITAQGLKTPANVRVKIEAGWDHAAHTQPVFRLMPGTHHELHPIKTRPRTAGTDVLVVTIQVDDINGLPIECVKGVIEIEIHQPQSDVKSDDISGMLKVIHDLTQNQQGQAVVRSAGWNQVELETDPQLASRLIAALPHNAVPGPAEMDSLMIACNPQAPFQANIHITPRQTGSEQNLLFVLGDSAAFGRGGDAGVSWWVRPQPFNALRWKRLSRRHCVIEIDCGYAWITDLSANGVWLNRCRLPAQRRQLLADGDSVELADTIPMTVLLTGDGQAVSAVTMVRSDQLVGRVTYVLTTGEAPVHLDVKQARVNSTISLFPATAVKGPGQPQLWVLHNGADPWLPVSEGQATNLEDGPTVYWQRMSQPADQDEIIQSGESSTTSGVNNGS